MGITLQGPTQPNTQPWEKNYNSEIPFECPPDCPHLQNCDGTAEGHNQFYNESPPPEPEDTLQMIDEDELYKHDQERKQKEDEINNSMNPEIQNRIPDDELNKFKFEPDPLAPDTDNQADPDQDQPEHQEVPELELNEQQLKQREEQISAAYTELRESYIQKEAAEYIEKDKEGGETAAMSNEWRLVMRGGMYDALLPNGTYLLDTVEENMEGSLTKAEWSDKLLEIYQNGYTEIPVFKDGEAIGMSVFRIESGVITTEYFEAKPQEEDLDEYDKQLTNTISEETKSENNPEDHEDLDEPEITTIPLTPFQQINRISFAENGISLEATPEQKVEDIEPAIQQTVIKGATAEFFTKVGIVIPTKTEVATKVVEAVTEVKDTSNPETAAIVLNMPADNEAQSSSTLMEAPAETPVEITEKTNTVKTEAQNKEIEQLEDLDAIPESITAPLELQIKVEPVAEDPVQITSSSAAPKAAETIKAGPRIVNFESPVISNTPDFPSESEPAIEALETIQESTPIEFKEKTAPEESVSEILQTEAKQETTGAQIDEPEFEEVLAKAERLVEAPEELNNTAELQEIREDLRIQISKARETVKALSELRVLTQNKQVGRNNREERREGIFSLLGLVRNGSRKSVLTDDDTRVSPLQPKAAKSLNLRKAA